jgi:hypothetical protein
MGLTAIAAAAAGDMSGRVAGSPAGDHGLPEPSDMPLLMTGDRGDAALPPAGRARGDTDCDGEREGERERDAERHGL